MTGRKHYSETKEKFSALGKGALGRVLSEENKQKKKNKPKMSAAALGRKHSDETR
jgi:hypothetical protein